MRKQRIALLMSAAMILSAMPVYAENTKHERVYAVTDPSGSVQTLIDNIRLENADNLDEITDMSMLDDIENVGGHEEFSRSEDVLVWNAGGNDITYQGTSEKELPVVPVVKVTADGKELSGEELKDLNGEITLNVSYQAAEDAALLAVSVIPLPEEAISGVKLTNAYMLSEGDKVYLAGWGLPGLASDADTEKDTDEDTDGEAADNITGRLHSSFEASFTASHADLSWMYTLCSPEPLDAFCTLAEKNADDSDEDAGEKLDEITALLHTLSEGGELPEAGEDPETLEEKLSALNKGLSDLDDGASDLCDGAASLSDGALEASEGAASLSGGLTTLSENSGTLNDGMSALFDAVLQTANEQLAASGLSDSGISVPVLTQENCVEALEGITEALSPEGLEAAVKEQVRAQVEENRDQITDAVTAEVKTKVTEGILQAAGIEMSEEEYLEAASAGAIDALTTVAVTTELDKQMNSDEIKEKIDSAVEEQIESLTDENAQAYLEGDEFAQKSAAAQAGLESITALKEQLSSVKSLADGLADYTGGVDQAAEGAGTLSAGISAVSDGAATLNEGAANLSEGMSTLHTTITDAEKEIADTLLPYVEGDAAQLYNLFKEAQEGSKNAAYDLRPDEMKTVTVYIIRTDM